MFHSNNFDNQSILSHKKCNNKRRVYETTARWVPNFEVNNHLNCLKKVATPLFLSKIYHKKKSIRFLKGYCFLFDFLKATFVMFFLSFDCHGETSPGSGHLLLLWNVLCIYIACERSRCSVMNHGFLLLFTRGAVFCLCVDRHLLNKKRGGGT